MTRFTKILVILSCFPGANAEVLNRRYQEGETLTYRMQGVSKGRPFEVRATGTVKRDSGGKYVEEYGGSDLRLNGSVFTLPPGSMEFRQTLSLDPDRPPAIPKLAGVHPMLIGPITDFLTFYADLWLAARSGKLTAAGDHFYHAHGTPASWADGSRVVLGESSIDFDLTLTDIDSSEEVATLVVRHVPPKEPQVKLAAAWMRQPVAGTPNNWVNLIREGDKYVAAVGQETFNVQIKVSLVDGKILSGMLENTVKARERNCVDAALTNCEDPRPREILRRITVSLHR
jgi:hypothetical protein